MPEMKVPVGSLIAVPHSSHRGNKLGLVVDQEAGGRWVARDPFPPSWYEDVPGLLLIRLMGEHTTELHHPDKEKLWGEEPRRVATTRWVYVKTTPNPPWVIAGPDTFSIEKFFGACRTCEALGMRGSTFMSEVQILLNHLKQSELVADEVGIFERRYRAMLADVLPLPG